MASRVCFRIGFVLVSSTRKRSDARTKGHALAFLKDDRLECKQNLKQAMVAIGAGNEYVSSTSFNYSIFERNKSWDIDKMLCFGKTKRVLLRIAWHVQKMVLRVLRCLLVAYGGIPVRWGFMGPSVEPHQVRMIDTACLTEQCSNKRPLPRIVRRGTQHVVLL